MPHRPSIGRATGASPTSPSANRTSARRSSATRERTPRSSCLRASPYAWVSYALASETLLVKAITEDDLRVTSFVQDTNSVQYMSFDMSAAIKDVTPGASAKPAYLAEIFGVKGDDELKPSQFSEDDLSTTFSSPVQGELMLKSTVTKDTDQFFMKMKVR